MAEKNIEPSLVSIVIPNWNGKRFLKSCLDSINEQSYGKVETWIVDNGSSDGSVELLKESYPEVKLVCFDHNTGFAPAVNAGIRASSGEFVALINNDTIVDRDWVKELVEVLGTRPELGSVGCKMLGYEDPEILDGVGDGYRRGGLPGRIGHGEKDIGLFNKERYILGACGGAAMYKRSLFDDIGMFDDDYFAYLEDVDMALRAQSAGYKCLYVPSAVIYHLGCGTTGSGYSDLVVSLSAQNNLNTIVKNIPLQLLIKFIPHILFWQAYYLAVVIVRGGKIIPWIKGTFKAILMMPKMLAKRREINKKRRVDNSYMEAIIVESENDLHAAKQRLNQQALEKKEAVTPGKPRS